MNNIKINTLPLTKFLIYILTFLVICIVGVSDVFAVSQSNYAEILPKLTKVEGWKCTGLNNCPNSSSFALMDAGDFYRYISTTKTESFTSNGVAFLFPVSTLLDDYLYSINIYTCSSSSLRNLDYYFSPVFYNERNVDRKTFETHSRISMGTIPLDNLEFNYCDMWSGLFVPSEPTNWLKLRFSGSSNWSSSIQFMGFELNELGIYNSALSSVIQETIQDSGFATAQDVQQVQSAVNEVQTQVNDLNDNITDDNVSGSLNGAGGFFGNFSSTDHGGLSGIISAPLTAINQMLNTNCTAMTANFKGKTISLPCGYDFWNRLGPIQDFINIALGGMFCYRIIVKLFKLIEKIKNPEDDRIEVMDL